MLRVWILSVEATVHFGIFSQREADPIAQSALSEIQTDEEKNFFKIQKYKIQNLKYTYHDKNATEGRLSAKPNQKFNLSQFVNFGDLVKIMSRQSRLKTIIYIVQCAVHCGFGGASYQRWLT